MYQTQSATLGYVYMGYWRYMVMADEEALREYDYFVSIDADAYLTMRNMPDPFETMSTNDLVGIFTIPAYQTGNIATGIQEAVEQVFSSGYHSFQKVIADEK
jgi:hypothetical protein